MTDMARWGVASMLILLLVGCADKSEEQKVTDGIKKVVAPERPRAIGCRQEPRPPRSWRCDAVVDATTLACVFASGDRGTCVGRRPAADGSSQPTRLDGANDERQIIAVMREYTIALARSDYRKACAFLTKEARAAWEDTGRRQVRRATCPAGIESLFGAAYSLDDLDAARRLTPSKIEIKGDTALAITGRSTSQRIPLRKISGRWLMDNAEYFDTYDAESAVRAWAAKRKRPGESIGRVRCGAIGDFDKASGETVGDQFDCTAEFRPGGRGCTVYLRATKSHSEARIVKVVTGTNYGTEIPEKPATECR